MYKQLNNQNIKKASQTIIHTANNQNGSALKCIHMISVNGGATHAAFLAIEKRIIAEQDVHGAYHLALLAQQTADIPIDAKQLIEMVVVKGDNNQRLSLLQNLPVPPVDMIKEQILKTDDGYAIGLMNAYLQIHPDGIGSKLTPASGQKDQIVPLNNSK